MKGVWMDSLLVVLMDVKMGVMRDIAKVSKMVHSLELSKASKKAHEKVGKKDKRQVV